MMFKLRIGQRVLLLFVIVAAVPVLTLNMYWLISQQKVLRHETEQRQSLSTDSAANRVDSFLTQKVNALILHAQTVPILRNDIKDATLELSNYSKQDKDIRYIRLANKAGKTLVEINGQNNAVKQSPPTETSFKIVTFLGGKEYISPVSYIEGRPHIQIAVPVLTFSQAQDFAKLSTSERGVIRGSDDINGALILLVDLSDVWSSIFANDTHTNTLSYIVDDQKRLISHPDSSISRSKKDLSDVPAVRYFFDNPRAKEARTIETNGLNGSRVLTTSARISTTNWTVITEDPIQTVEAAANNVARTVLQLNVVFIVAAIVIGFAFSRSITKPIRKLADDARIMGEGNFDSPIESSRRDEIGSLARSLNTMGQKLKTLISHIASERNQLDLILNSISEGVFALDADGTIRLANQTALKLFGATEKRILNTKLSELTAFKQDVSEIRIDITDISPDEAITEFKDLQFTDSHGAQRFVDVIVGKLLRDENGIAAIVTVIDQTASRELEAMKIDFVSLAAHELRTPLTAIRGYLELMLRDQDSVLAEKHRHYCLQATDSAGQLGSLINNLLNVSKIERNALRVTMEKLDLVSTVSGSVHNLQFSAEKAKIRLIYNGPDASSLYVIGDSVALREVIDNLITNALHYTPAGGTVTVSQEEKNGMIFTHVQDTGIGIPKDLLHKLFTKFFRVHGGLATGSGGSGLGLYISKSIVELHGGSISVESEEGVGTTFSFSIPAFDEEKFRTYREMAQQPVRRRRGWTTKDTPR